MAPRRPRAAPRPLAEPLKVALRQADLLPTLQLVEVVQAWEALVGDALARQAWPEALRDGVLVVATAHPAWKQELLFRQAEVLARLAEVVGPRVVRSLATVLRPRRPGPPPPLTPGAEACAAGRRVTEDAGVRNQPLREALERAAAANAEARSRGLLRGPP